MMKQEHSFIQNPVFICGHRKSGTTLLVSLLDFHRQLLVYPEESNFFFKYFPFADDLNLSLEEKAQLVIDKCVLCLKETFEKRCTGYSDDYLDFNKIESELQQLLTEPALWPQVLTNLIKAFAQTTPQPIEPVKYWVEKTTSSEVFALEIARAFPTGKFIHIVRDPRDNYASLKTGFEKRYQFMPDTPTLEALLQSCIERGRLGLELAIKNQEILGSQNYMVIRYESLVSSTEKVLGDIASFLSIDPSGFKLTPTTCGLPWKGNNEGGKDFSGVSNEQVGRWRRHITRHEAALLEYHFAQMMDVFEYPFETSRDEQVSAAGEHYKWLNFKRNCGHLRPEKVAK